MRTVLFLFMVVLSAGLSSCAPSQRTTKVVKPKYHATSPNNRWRVDIPVGARHIRFLERKRTHVVKMH